MTPQIPEEPEEANMGLEAVKAKRERSKSSGPATAKANSESTTLKITIADATPKAASATLAKRTAAKRTSLDVIGGPPPKKGFLSIEDVQPNTISRNAAAPGDSGGASSSAAAAEPIAAGEPKAKAKAKPKAKSAAKTPEATPEPKARGRPRKTTPDPNAPPKLNYAFTLAKKFEIKRLLTTLNNAHYDGDVSMLDATLLENKIKHFKAKPNTPSLKAIKGVLQSMYSRLPPIMIKG